MIMQYFILELEMEISIIIYALLVSCVLGLSYMIARKIEDISSRSFVYIFYVLFSVLLIVLSVFYSGIGIDISYTDKSAYGYMYFIVGPFLAMAINFLILLAEYYIFFEHAQIRKKRKVEIKTICILFLVSYFLGQIVRIVILGRIVVFAIRRISMELNNAGYTVYIDYEDALKDTFLEVYSTLALLFLVIFFILSANVAKIKADLTLKYLKSKAEDKYR